ncbi:MAG TPA: hypothetical protein VLQ45_27150 [Thermoanaerobaculia bacterium]|nr:hypothetical protein [Thermoanaerobaculia bacterium]
MTSIVGVLCRDGAVIGTDSATTFGGRLRTIEQATEKLDLIGDEIILAGAGSTGLRQRFRDIVEDAWVFSGRHAFTGADLPEVPSLEI